MSANSREFTDFVLDQLAPLRDLSAARLFGGVGIRAEGCMFALIMRGALYFASDDETRPHYEALGSARFSYQTRARRVETKFFEVPADMLDDREQLLSFARAAVGVARKAALARASRGKKRPPA
jgi:DNA transformation protein